MLVLLLAACSPITPTTIPPTPTPLPAAAPTQPSIQLEPCSAGSFSAQCGTLKVYENREAKSGRTIDLRVVVIKAWGDHPAPDPVFYLAGGPGVAAASGDGTHQQFSNEMMKNHDVVFVDQRGTGESNRVDVPLINLDTQSLTSADVGGQNVINIDPAGLSPEQLDARIRAEVDKYLAGIEIDPRFYTTSMAMDDLDDVRAALGYDKINLFGASYGASAAQYYLRQHEDHVRSVTLYVGTLLDYPMFEHWAQNGQKALDQLFALCQADENCNAAYPNLRQEFYALLARLADQPAQVQWGGGTVELTPDLFAEIVRVIMVDANQDPLVPLLIHRAYQDNDWSMLADHYAEWGPADWDISFMARVIRCSENWAAFNPQEVARWGEGSYLKGWYVSLAENHALACQYTPRGVTPEGQSSQPRSNVPVLIVNGDLDPQDPIDGMAGAKDLWPNSVSLVMPYQAHHTTDYAHTLCLFSLEDQFVESGSAQGLDTSCMKNLPPLTFQVPHEN